MLLLITQFVISKTIFAIHYFSHLSEINQIVESEKSNPKNNSKNQSENHHDCDQCLNAKINNYFDFSAVNFSLNYFIFIGFFLILANQEVFNFYYKKSPRAPPFIV